MANRGHAGFYKNVYLRSSYEYAYAKYLDFYKIKWEFEIQVFNLGYKLYKPDFFILNPNNSIKKIVEIKSRNKKAIEQAKTDLKIISEQYGYDVDVISYKELLELYKPLPFSLNSVITEWINSDHTTINKAAFGALNGHYQMKHNDSTKKKIGAHTKLLWETDSISKLKMIEGLKKSGMKKGFIKVPRVERECLHCNKPFITLETSIQKYCSRTCSGSVAIKLATEASINKQLLLHQEIKKYVIAWTIKNNEIVEKAPFNKIKPTIDPLLREIELKYGIKDLRIISKAIFGKDCGRKELLKFMKSICNENVC